MKIDSYFSEVERLWSDVKNEFENWQKIDSELLKRKPAVDKWSALECIEHLNQTYRLYIPNLEKALSNTKTNPSPRYKPGLFGNFMISSVGIKNNGKAKMPMKTFSFFEPQHYDQLEKSKVVTDFLTYHEKLNQFIQQSKNVNINKIKVQSAISVMKFRLGVCFLFLLNHELRHLAQGNRAMNITN